MPTYSHSRLSTFEQCPLKFKYTYIDELEAEIEETIEAFLGSRVHETLEKLYNDLKFQKLNSLKELIDFFNEEWKKNWNDAIIIVRQDYSQENFRKMGEKFIGDFYARYHPFNNDLTIATEKRIVLNLDKEGKYVLQGYIDRLASVGDTYIIHDYKTSSSLPTQEYIDRDRQLALYSIAVKNDYQDCHKVKLVWHYLAFDKRIESERADEEIEKLKQDTIQLIRRIEGSQDYPAKSSALCNWCEFRPVCPSFRHLYKIEELPADEYLADDGIRLVNKYAELWEIIKKSEMEIEKVRQALIKFAEKERVNTAYGSDIKADIRKFTSMKFPSKHDENKDRFNELIKQLGLWEKLASVDKYELAKMINNHELHPDFIKLLQEFIIKVENYRISLKKK